MSGDHCFRPSPHLLSTPLLMRTGLRITLLCEAFPKPTTLFVKPNKSLCIAASSELLEHSVRAYKPLSQGTSPFPKEQFSTHVCFQLPWILWSPPQWKGVKGKPSAAGSGSPGRHECGSESSEKVWMAQSWNFHTSFFLYSQASGETQANKAVIKKRKKLMSWRRLKIKSVIGRSAELLPSCWV